MRPNGRFSTSYKKRRNILEYRRQFGSFCIPSPATKNSGQTPDRSTTYHTISLPTVNDQNMDTATPTKQNVTDRELDPTKPQSTGNDKFKTQLSTETLTLVTINIEGFHGNQVYLQTLANRADILLLQEHWLHTFEKHKLDDFLPDYVCLTKCFDDCIVQDPIMRHRGHGGVAICIHNKYEHLIEPIPDGGNRIVGIRLNTTPPILILCVYLPCRRNSNTDLFQETLDELSEIIEKYKNKANILLGGDMNASLRRDSAQDRQFKCFLNENDMKVPPKSTNSATFFHFNGKDTSQIDYVLESTSMINEYVNFEREALNTSTHDPILVRFSCYLEGKTQNPGVNYTKRIKWNKIDKQEYTNNVEAKLTTLQEINQPITKCNIDKVVNELHDILYSCT